MVVLTRPVYKLSTFSIQLFMVTIAVYLVSTLLLFYLDLKMVRRSPVVFDNVRAPHTKTLNAPNISHYKAIWERNLFGTKTAEDEKPAASDLLSQIDQLALTSLNCTLIGTIIHENGESWAIISQGNQQEKYRRPGQGPHQGTQVAEELFISRIRADMADVGNIHFRYVLDFNAGDYFLIVFHFYPPYLFCHTGSIG